MGYQMWIGRVRGEDRRSGSLFSYVDLEARVPADHPLRPIRTIVDDALSGLSGELEALYSHLGPAARAAAAGTAPTGVLLGAFGAAADGAARLQPFVSVVRGARD